MAFLICTTLVSQSAFASATAPTAEAFNLQSWNQTSEALRMRYNFVSRAALIKAGDPEVESKYKSTNIAQAGRVLLLITVLAGVQVVREQVRAAHLSGKTLTKEEYAKIIGQAAAKVADSGDVWMGIGSDLAIGAISKRPMQAFDAILKNKVAQPIFQDLVKNGIMSLIYFVGFQACAQLWRDARLMLDQKDYDRSERIWSTGVLGVIELAHSDQNSDDARVARQMVINMAKILVYDDELRDNWFYNTWRLDIATGRFVTLVSGIVAATTAGTLITPGYGTVAGFLYALIGATAAAALPPSVNDRISLKIKEARIAARKFQAHQWNWRLRNLIAASDRGSFFWHWLSNPKEIKDTLANLKEIREHVATGYIEKAYLADTNVQKFTQDLTLAQNNHASQKVISDVNLQLRKHLENRLNALLQLTKFYETEYNELAQVGVSSDASVQNAIEQTKFAIISIHSFVKTFAEATLRANIYPSNGVLLQNLYLRSFKETPIVQLAHQQLLARHAN